MRGLPPALVLAIAIMAGATMDATIKYLALTNHVLVVTLGRYVFGAVFALAIWAHAGRPTINAEMWRAHTIRGFVIAGAATTFFWALTVLPLAQAVAMSFIYPLIVPFVARVLIGERVRISSLVSAAIGFVGVVIAAQDHPDTLTSPYYGLGVASVLVSASLFAVAMVLLRQRAQRDGAPIIGVMTTLIPALILFGPTLVFAPPPQLSDWPIFVALGALAAVFMYLLARAYAGAEAQQLAPIHYTELIWASVIGYLVFQETPRLNLYLGAALIVAACLYTAYEERRAARAA